MSETHRIPTVVSTDLVNWTYVGDACPAGGGALPAWLDPSAAFWAPEVVFSSTTDRYYPFVTVDRPVDVVGPAGGPAPARPRRRQVLLLLDLRPGGARGHAHDTGMLYYGSYYGGVFATRVDFTPTGATAGTASTADDTRITIGNRYEGAEVVYRDGYYYLFGSATNCYA